MTTKFQRDTLAALKALDYDAFARSNGTVEVTVLTDLVAGVDEAASQAALHEMEAAGADLELSEGR